MTKLRENGFAVALAAGLGLALAVGIIYAVAAGSRRLARDAEALHVTHQTIQAATVARGQLELAAYQASLARRGVDVDAAALDAARSRAESSLAAAAEAYTALEAIEEGTVPGRASLRSMVNTGSNLLAAIDSGGELGTAGVESQYAALIADLTATRDRLAGEVAGSDRSNTWITSLGGFLAVLVIPSAVIATYFVLDRRRRRQHELEVTLQAEQAALASRERFLTTVSHQLREPLWAVRGISRMLGNDEMLMAQPHMADLHILLAGELDDMSGLMDNLLIASRLEAGGLDFVIEPLDAREVTRTVVDSLDHRGATIYVGMQEGEVSADRRYLRQIIRNLVTNALKFGGPSIEVKGRAQDGSYVIVVVDDGQGVPPDIESQLFTRFVHGESDAGSVGLGLSVVMALAVAMGGTAFHKREDGLTRFGVALPLAESVLDDAPRYEPPSINPVPRAVG